MKTSEMMIGVDKLETCPWNPRGEITPESVADLTASIKARGLLQNIGVWKRPDADGYYVIFGNRRFVACVNAMIASIPCKVFECSEVEAHEITRIENEARLGVSPIADARLIGKMLDLGYSGKEIAAHFAVSEAQVTRRRKLLDLSPAWESRAQKTDIPTDTLEHVAAYPRAIQDKVLSKVSDWLLREGWPRLKIDFMCIAKDLDRASFVEHDPALAARCKACPKRTGAQADLFDDVKPGTLGRCLDGTCFEKSRNAWKAKMLEDAIPGTVKERVSVDSWEIEQKGLKKKPDAENTAAYYYFDECRARVVVKYGPSKAEKKAREKAEREKRAKEDAEMKARAEILARAKKKCVAWTKGKELSKMALEWAAKDKGVYDPWILVLVMIYFRMDTYNISLEKAGGLLGEHPDHAWIHLFSDQIFETFRGYVQSDRLLSVGIMFPDMLKGLTPEELKALKEDAR
ncbi:MAG: ParB/RepB/Spo0J family partition protein [Kiritimatiellae bacterium]|nr:ParB/RepB/Spo0J family partition protein [Kiritimatiellia bacterium]